MGGGPGETIRGIYDDITGKGEGVPFLPEVLEPYKRAGLVPKTDEDKLGRSLIFYIYTGADGKKVEVNEYQFRATLYEAQVAYYKRKLELPEKKIRYYKAAIKAIDDRFVQRISQMKLKDSQIEMQEGRAQVLQENYNRDLSAGLFVVGDSQERALKEDIARARGDVPDLPNFDSYVYSGAIVDLDHPEAGDKYYPDLRILQKDYENRADAMGDDLEYNSNKEKLSESEAALRKAKSELKVYNDSLKE